MVILAACNLLQTPLADDQRTLVSQVIFDALRMLLQAQQEIGPLSVSAAYSGQRTPIQDQEAFDHIDLAKELCGQLLADPARCAQILDSICK